MSYPICVKAVICYIEAHIKDERIDYEELQERIGFSLSHIRALFAENTGFSLAQYIRMRKVKCSALELINTDNAILQIAYEFGFSNPETYTRAFRQVTGTTPSAFRTQRLIVGKEELFTGVYGIGILNFKEQRSDIVMDKKMYINNESTILYGVPRAAYGQYGGGTPYPICLKACSEYLGENLEYYFTMASSVAAFRFVWNREIWDLSNVDIFHTFNETNEIYGVGAKALGREFSFLERDKHTAKDDFIAFIKKHIDEGYPCIALGIIGPPEPCIITGYRKNGEELLGWNFFQNDTEFAAELKFDESGYFISSSWWENTDTQAVMCMGAINGEKLPAEAIIANAHLALSGRIEGSYCKGIIAYEAWKEAMKNERNFTVDGNYSLLFEKMLCQMDAMTCLTDGRSCAAQFFRQLSKEAPARCRDYQMIADAFERCAAAVNDMWTLFGDNSDMDEMLKRLADKTVRKNICQRIDIAAKADADALALMEKLIS